MVVCCKCGEAATSCCLYLELPAEQVLTKLAGDMWLAATAAYKAGDAAGLSQHGGRLLQLLLDMDALLASVPCACLHPCSVCVPARPT